MKSVVCLQHREGDTRILYDADVVRGHTSAFGGTPAGRSVFTPGSPAMALSDHEKERSSHFTVPRRREEWLLGRMTARAAIAALMESSDYEVPAPAALEIIAGDDGAPRVMWLKGEGMPAVSLSLTHQGGWAAAWAAFDEPTIARGIDLEVVQAREPGLVEQFFGEEEQRWLAGLEKARQDWGVNVIWSLKEAALKALKVGLRVDTRTIRVLGVHESGRADLVIDRAVSGDLSVLSATWDWHGDQVLTRVVLGDPIRDRAWESGSAVRRIAAVPLRIPVAS